MTPPVCELTIRDVGPADLSVITALNRAIFADTWHPAWSEASLRQVLTMPGAFSWISISGEAPTGFVLISVIADEAELLLIGVAPQFRGLGHGRALLDRACSEAAKRGAKRIHLEHAQDNAAARLYRRSGFVQVGQRPGYYLFAGTRKDALLLAKELSLQQS
jgi:ribosomal-protein-alanine N-acetyltransferase